MDGGIQLLKHSTSAFIISVSAAAFVLQIADAQVPADLTIESKNIEIQQRVFKGERDTIEQLKAYSPVFETYTQSLWPDTTDQIPLSDAQFVGRIDFYDFITSRDESAAMLFGTSKGGLRVLNDNGQRWSLYVDGFLAMLFIDPTDFDADRYRLTPLGSSKLDGADCLLFDVAPIDTKAAGRFRGTIWVEPEGYRVVRIQGTFQAPRVNWRSRLNPAGSTVYLNFKFDSWRRKIAPNLWAPASVIVDDNIPWRAMGKDGTTDIHDKSVTFVWGYSHIGSFQWQRDAVVARDPAAEPQVIGLVADGIVAPKGSVEASLDAIIAGISDASRPWISGVSCRVLLTTNVELFHIGNTILMSRGLLEMAPNNEVLTALLAHELAHIVNDGGKQLRFDYEKTLFEHGRTLDFSGLGIKTSAQEEEKAAALTCDILADAQHGAANGKALAFIKQLATIAQQVPSLARARVGIGFVESGNGAHILKLCTPSEQVATDIAPLQLKGSYLVDILTGQLLRARQ